MKYLLLLLALTSCGYTTECRIGAFHVDGDEVFKYHHNYKCLCSSEDYTAPTICKITVKDE